MIEAELKVCCEIDPEISDWLSAIYRDNKDIWEQVVRLEPANPRRLAALDPRLLKRVVTAKTGIHLRVAEAVKPILDMVMIQRSQGSTLPTSDETGVSLKGLFKKMIRQTATVSRRPEEEMEYQFWHRKAAK
jgi:hypothetical protein